MVFNKNHLSKWVCGTRDPLETPPPFMANAILNFHFDFPHTSLRAKNSFFFPPCPVTAQGRNIFVLLLILDYLLISNNFCLYFHPYLHCQYIFDVS